MSETNLLSDYLDLEPFAKEVSRHPRTVRRWMDEPNGLPFTRIGNRILVHIPTARAWIFGRMRKPNPPHKRARKVHHDDSSKFDRPQRHHARPRIAERGV
jgi:hypothetical protein